MTPGQFKALKRGDIVRHKSRDESFVVTDTYGDRVTAVRSVDMTNPDEWDIVSAAIMSMVEDDGDMIPQTNKEPGLPAGRQHRPHKIRRRDKINPWGE